MVKRIAREERGATAVIVAIALVVVLGMAALAVDAGVLLQERRHLQNAADAAAMAGAQQVAMDVTQAKEVAYQYAEKNGVSRSEVTEVGIVTVFNTGDAFRVKTAKQVNLLFAPVLGTQFSTVGAQATAILTPIEWKKIWPWGVPQSDVVNGEVTLKVGARNNIDGNFMALDLGGPGGRNYEDNIRNGYNGPVPDASVSNPWLVDTETGNLVGPTMDGVSYLLGSPYSGAFADVRNPRVGIVPILADDSWADVAGKKEVEVVGFAIFYLDDVSPAPGGQAEVHGGFMRYAYGVGRARNIGGALDGLIGARLWQ